MLLRHASLPLRCQSWTTVLHSSTNLLPTKSRIPLFKNSFSRLYATHRDLPKRTVRGIESSTTNSSASSWATLTRPFAVTLVFTGTSFTLAYYLDTHPTTASSTLRPDPETKLKVLTGLIALNCGVFGAFYIPPYSSIGAVVYRLLSRYAMLDPRHVHRYPLSILTSGFSHSEIWHLGLNMVGFYTVGSAVYDLLGTNQFLAFYGSAICWSGMAQLAAGCYRVRRGVLPRPSLGASGGIYALLGAVAWYAPNASLYLLFFPFVPIKLGLAFTGMMTLDFVGLYRGWSTFGHAAHLSGGMLGLSYGITGMPEAWMQKRREAMQKHLNRWIR